MSSLPKKIGAAAPAARRGQTKEGRASRLQKSRRPEGAAADDPPNI
jgi:hypothetical protein